MKTFQALAAGHTVALHALRVLVTSDILTGLGALADVSAPLESRMTVTGVASDGVHALGVVVALVQPRLAFVDICANFFTSVIHMLISRIADAPVGFVFDHAGAIFRTLAASFFTRIVI